jgi:hypothetical protein
MGYPTGSATISVYNLGYDMGSYVRGQEAPGGGVRS